MLGLFGFGLLLQNIVNGIARLRLFKALEPLSGALPVLYGNILDLRLRGNFNRRLFFLEIPSAE